MTRKYFPNNWRAVKDTPDRHFPPLSYEDFEDWKIHGYMIPDSITGMLRITSPITGKVQEKIYTSPYYCRKRIAQCIKNNEEFVLCTDEGLYQRTFSDNLPLDFNND